MRVQFMDKFLRSWPTVHVNTQVRLNLSPQRHFRLYYKGILVAKAGSNSKFTKIFVPLVFTEFEWHNRFCINFEF